MPDPRAVAVWLTPPQIGAILIALQDRAAFAQRRIEEDRWLRDVGSLDPDVLARIESWEKHLANIQAANETLVVAGMKGAPNGDDQRR